MYYAINRSVQKTMHDSATQRVEDQTNQRYEAAPSS